MRNTSEVIGEISIHDVKMTFEHMAIDFANRLLGITARSVGILLIE
ncbi:hypothetical protein ACH50O_02075 [Methylomonas sp. 2BW1-5-20]